MKTKEYQESIVVKQIERKHDLKIKGLMIQELKNNSSGQTSKGDVGIKTKGKIDFLVNYCGYNHMFVNRFE